MHDDGMHDEAVLALLWQRLGVLLRERRAECGRSQRWLAEQAGVTQATVSAVECSRRRVGLGTYDRMLGALGRRLSVELEDRDTDLAAQRAQGMVMSTAARLEAAAPYRAENPLRWLSTSAGWALTDELALAAHGVVMHAPRISVVVAENGPAWPALFALILRGDYRPPKLRHADFPESPTELASCLRDHPDETWLGRWAPLSVFPASPQIVSGSLLVRWTCEPGSWLPREQPPLGVPNEGEITVPVLNLAELAALHPRHRRVARYLLEHPGERRR